MLRTYQGSCHCGAVKFSADIDFSQGTHRCNCSYCAKVRNWNIIIRPDAFRLLSGEGSLSDYQFGSNAGHHFFCTRCGVRPFERGFLEQIGGDYVSVMVAALDDIPPAELASLPVKYDNGRDDQWWVPPAETRYL